MSDSKIKKLERLNDMLESIKIQHSHLSNTSKRNIKCQSVEDSQGGKDTSFHSIIINNGTSGNEIEMVRLDYNLFTEEEASKIANEYQKAIISVLETAQEMLEQKEDNFRESFEIQTTND